MGGFPVPDDQELLGIDADVGYRISYAEVESVESTGYGRRLASMFEATSILSTLAVTMVSLLVWYLFFRGQSSQDRPRRRTTIIKKRPTFVKGKRRSHKPTLSTLRSDRSLLV